MFSAFPNIFRVPELKSRVLFVLGILLVYRIGTHIPVPGVNIEALAESFKSQNNGILGFLNLFSGNALKQASIFALGVMPYISMSIILQLLTAVIPTLEKLSKEGEMGRRKITQYTRIGTVALCLIQGTGTTYLFKNFGENVIYHWGLGFQIMAVIGPNNWNRFHHVARGANHRIWDWKWDVYYHFFRDCCGFAGSNRGYFSNVIAG